MAERTDQRTRESDVDLDAELGSSTGGTVDTDVGSVLGTDDGPETVEDDSGGGRIRGWISEKVGSIFSIQTFGIALVLTVVLAFVTGIVVPFVPASALLGVFLGGFLLGAATDDRSYLEVGAATLLTGAVTALLGNVTATLFGLGVPLVAFGAGASGLAGLLGHYFGRDLRAGLSRDID